jgi:hypothetical protein
VFEEGAAQVGSVSDAACGFARLGSYGLEVFADEVRHVGFQEVTPEVLDRVELGRVRRQVFHLQPGALSLQISLNLRASMCGKAIPQQNRFTTCEMSFQGSKIFNDLRLFDRAGQQAQAQPHAPRGGRRDEARNRREPLPSKRRDQDRRLTFWSPRAMNRRAFRKAAFVQKNQDRTTISSFFLIAGQLCLIQRRMAGSLRSRARDSGRWQLHPSSPRSFQTCPG